MDKKPQNAQNVLTMSDYQPDTGYAPIAQVEAYWEALRGARLLPKRSDIDPRGIEQALEYAFILERIAAGVARLRIAGSHLNTLMGMEVRGMPLTAFFRPEARRDLSDALEVVFQTPAVATLNLTSSEGASRPEISGRMILLPLKSDLGDVSRVLGCLVTKGDIGLSPRRFEIAHQNVVPLITGNAPLPAPVSTAKPKLPAPASAPQPPRGFAEGTEGFDGPAAKRRPPYLRLVKSDD